MQHPLHECAGSARRALLKAHNFHPFPVIQYSHFLFQVKTTPFQYLLRACNRLMIESFVYSTYNTITNSTNLYRIHAALRLQWEPLATDRWENFYVADDYMCVATLLLK
jgi:hypothetical protein